MLAQLRDRPEVDSVAVDRHGELLRLRLRDGAPLGPLREALEALGFAAEPVGPSGAGRWYGPAEVGELSGEEAAVIAARVVGAAGLAGRTDADALRGAVAGALHRTFVAQYGRHAPGAALAAACAAATEGAVAPLAGPEAARALGAAVAADLARDR